MSTAKSIYATDTGGNPIKRLSHAAIRRVLSDPLNITAAAGCDYSLVHYEPLGLSLVATFAAERWSYEVSQQGRETEAFSHGHREQAIKRFWDLMHGVPSAYEPDNGLAVAAHASQPLPGQLELFA